MRTALGGQASSLPNEYLSKDRAGRMPALPVPAPDLCLCFLWMHGEGFVLRCLHNLTLTRTFVVDAAEMQYAVNDDAA